MSYKEILANVVTLAKRANTVVKGESTRDFLRRDAIKAILGF